MISLDAIDRRILDRLQKDGRVSNADLAEQVGLSSSPCWRRVKALEAAGVIKGYAAQVDAKQLAAFKARLAELKKIAPGAALKSLAAKQAVVKQP